MPPDQDVAPPAASPPAKRHKATTVPASDEPAAATATATETTAPPVADLADLAGPAPLQVKRLDDRARLPTRGSALAAGYDLYAARETVVPAQGKVLVDTGLAIAVPPGTYGRIAPRSGLASKHFIDTGAGVIDPDYRGKLMVLLFNHGPEDFAVGEGDRVAQLVLERIYTPDVVEVDELEVTVRGAGGFGSTGKA